jgi:hypothetical protein
MFEAWLTENGATAREVILATFKTATGRQTVELRALQEAGLCSPDGCSRSWTASDRPRRGRQAGHERALTHRTRTE